jgi:hypothetical protein
MKCQKVILRDFVSSPYYPTPLLSPVTPKGILEIECQLMSPTRRFFKIPNPFAGGGLVDQATCTTELVAILLDEVADEAATDQQAKPSAAALFSVRSQEHLEPGCTQ